LSGKWFKRVFISVDMEGISGIVHGSETGRDKGEYEKGRRLMVADVNAAIEGVLSVADAEVVVSDGHGSMRNIVPEELHEAAVLVRGSPKPLTQMSGIDDSFDAALFVGYHSRKGTKHGILSHTISGRTIESITINGMEVGETGINGGIAGYYGVPLIFVSGDKAVAEEARELNPGIKTVAVKEAVSRTAAKVLNPKKARELITKGVKEALEAGPTDTIVFKSPVEAKVRYVNALMADAVAFMPSAERLDGKTIRFVQDDYIKAFGAFRASIFIAGTVSN
jgi:D-amino peptidase